MIRHRRTRILVRRSHLLDEHGQIVMGRRAQLKRLDSAARQSRESTENDWLYGLQWQIQSWSGTEPTHEGRWLIFADRTGIAAVLAEQLDCDLVHPGRTYLRDGSSFAVNPQHPADFRTLLEDVCGDGEFPYRGIVHCWSLDAAPVEELTPSALDSAEDLVCLSTLHLVQALAQTGWRDAPRLWLVTRGRRVFALKTARRPWRRLTLGLARRSPTNIGAGVHQDRLDPQRATVRCFASSAPASRIRWRCGDARFSPARMRVE